MGKCRHGLKDHAGLEGLHQKMPTNDVNVFDKKGYYYQGWKYRLYVFSDSKMINQNCFDAGFKGFNKLNRPTQYIVKTSITSYF